MADDDIKPEECLSTAILDDTTTARYTKQIEQYKAQLEHYKRMETIERFEDPLLDPEFGKAVLADLSKALAERMAKNEQDPRRFEPRNHLTLDDCLPRERLAGYNVTRDYPQPLFPEPPSLIPAVQEEDTKQSD